MRAKRRPEGDSATIVSVFHAGGEWSLQAASIRILEHFMGGMDAIVAEFLAESVENLDQLDQDLVTLEKNPSDREIFAPISEPFTPSKEPVASSPSASSNRSPTLANRC